MLYLKFYNQMSYEEISEVMGISYQASRNLVYKSLQTVREQMLTVAGWLVLAGDAWGNVVLGMVVWVVNCF